MESIPLPSVVSITPGETKHTARITIEPFFPGYGTTVGNALRRVLLSSLPGAALTSFSAKGVQHEFSNIPNVKEDFVEIALNLKLVRLKVHSAEPVRLKLQAKGEGKVTAGSIAPSSDVEIINHDQLIATLTDDAASLELELVASQGRGYTPTEAREKETLEVGMIALDALYSPVRKVGFQIESVRVGQMTNWEKLMLDMETDGSITPRDALQLAINYLTEHLLMIRGKLDDEQPAAEEKLSAEPVASAVIPPLSAVTENTGDATAGQAEAPAEPKAKRRSKKAATAAE